ncbi:hypothetical protein TELCIR_03453 [Teladorsagia circumcincta]|uniref:Uncharacterized protein n=1 Tax=Teladorsagia circumcincta TaxID=45464 RepID=A0A2G9UWD8_TELCI|nr:hypothetical protein TELCIR_03453 [Teladorsagia circumcincta]
MPAMMTLWAGYFSRGTCSFIECNSLFNVQKIFLYTGHSRIFGVKHSLIYALLGYNWQISPVFVESWFGFAWFCIYLVMTS